MMFGGVGDGEIGSAEAQCPLPLQTSVVHEPSEFLSVYKVCLELMIKAAIREPVQIVVRGSLPCS
jgi:hypothetical protein